MRESITLGRTPLTTRELVLAMLMLAGLDPRDYPDPEAKSLIYKAKSFKEKG